MNNPPNILCAYCQNKLYESGVVISSYVGPLLMCSTCRGLYYVDVIVDASNQSALAIQTTKFPKEDEFDLIRNSVNPISLPEYIASRQGLNMIDNARKDKENTNLKKLISSSVTPSDLLRKLSSNE